MSDHLRIACVNKERGESLGSKLAEMKCTFIM